MVIEQGRAYGRLRAALDTELAIDLLFGPVVFRLLNGTATLDTDEAATIARMAMRAIVADQR